MKNQSCQDHLMRQRAGLQLTPTPSKPTVFPAGRISFISNILAAKDAVRCHVLLPSLHITRNHVRRTLGQMPDANPPAQNPRQNLQDTCCSLTFSNLHGFSYKQKQMPHNPNDGCLRPDRLRSSPAHEVFQRPQFRGEVIPGSRVKERRSKIQKGSQ